MVSELINKYLWLLQTLIEAGDFGLSLGEICRKFEARFDSPYSRRTFNNHRAAIEEVFGIRIACNRSRNRYYIPYGEEALDNDASVGWLINTFTVNSLLTLGRERLSGRVSVEEIPSGQKHLTTIMQAMQDGKELEIAYRKYSSEPSAQPERLHVQPFAVKEHEKRWYLVGFCRERARKASAPNSDTTAWRVYGLDRISSIQVTDIRFKMPRDFDVDRLFYNSYGIYFPKAGQKAVTIRFRTTATEANYIRDLPLHRSQQEERTRDGEVIFKLRVIPNDNLIMEFCKHGDRIEVLEPAEVRSAVTEALRSAWERYSPADDPGGERRQDF
jgi:hypothetical protein